MTPTNPQIGATAMVYGLDIHTNLRRLSADVRHAEILLYWTPEGNNFPEKTQAAAIKTLAEELEMQLSVHLPTMLDLVSEKAITRRKHLDILLRLLEAIAIWQPAFYVLHTGPNPPTLHAINPINYIHFTTRRDLASWYEAACDVLEEIQAEFGLDSHLLLENLDFSPLLLKPFAERGLAAICLDIGHVWLGNENLEIAFEACAPYIKEMHLHGVHEGQEHLSLTATTADKLKALRNLLQSVAFAGILNLEVFAEEDFRSSLNWLRQIS